MSMKSLFLGKSAPQDDVYNNAPLWRLIMWPLGESGRMLFLMVMMLLSFYVTGIAGVGVVLVGAVITGTRVFDAINDPLIGLFIDKTQGKFGKIRPFVIGSWLLMTSSAFLIFFTTHHVPENIRLIYFIIVYVLYMLGYSALGMTYAAANPIITNNPKQRPVIFSFSMIFTSLIGSGFGMYMGTIAPRHGGFGSVGLFHELLITFTILSSIMTVGALIAIWKLDNPESFSIGGRPKITLKDMWLTLKGNRPLQIFMLTNISDRLAQNIANNQIVNVMLFGIIIGDFTVMGAISGVMLIPNIITLLFGMKFIGKFGAKKAYVYVIWVAIIFGTLTASVLMFGDPTQIRFSSIGMMTIAFVGFNFVFNVARLLSQVCVGPMRPDIIDYETYRSGKFAPGIIIATDSFIDKMVVSFYPALVSVVVASIGFREYLPDLDTPLTNSIMAVTIFLGFGVLFIAWIISLICMKFYPLDREKMVEIQAELKKRREAESQVASEA